MKARIRVLCAERFVLFVFEAPCFEHKCSCSVFKHVKKGDEGCNAEIVCFALSGVAQAFNEKTKTHPVLLDMVKKFWGEENVDSTKLKLAQVTTQTPLCRRFNKNCFCSVKVNKIW